jgi:FixJ family two-component response regulator
LTNSSTELGREHYLCSTTIARMVAKGYPNKTIAAVLDISS